MEPKLSLTQKIQIAFVIVVAIIIIIGLASGGGIF